MSLIFTTGVLPTSAVASSNKPPEPAPRAAVACSARPRPTRRAGARRAAESAGTMARRSLIF